MTNEAWFVTGTGGDKRSLVCHRNRLCQNKSFQPALRNNGKHILSTRTPKQQETNPLNPNSETIRDKSSQPEFRTSEFKLCKCVELFKSVDQSGVYNVFCSLLMFKNGHDFKTDITQQYPFWRQRSNPKKTTKHTFELFELFELHETSKPPNIWHIWIIWIIP